MNLIGKDAPADKPPDVTNRVLIVDDHPLTREALAALLDQQGFAVVGQAADGAEAIDCARRLQPGIVLLDLSMPGMDGFEALPRLRAAAPACEVVVLTASGTEDNLLRAIRAGAAGYLLKSEPPSGSSSSCAASPTARPLSRARSPAGCSSRFATAAAATAASRTRSRLG